MPTIIGRFDFTLVSKKQDSCGREQVERYTAFLEALKEAWTDLQTDAEHEQNKSEVLNKGHGVFGGSEANMAC